MAAREEIEMIEAAELDRIFDEGEQDVLQYFDTEHVRYPGREAHAVATYPASGPATK